MDATTLTLAVLTPVFFFALWHITANVTPPAIPSNLQNKRVILLIAHPDDESMFFSPALQALTRPSLGNHVKVLCLSTGNADGLGETRKKELEAAAVTLGVRRREDVFVMDDPRFKDGMKETWDPKEIARVLAQAFAPHLMQASSTSAADVATRDKKHKSSRSVSGSATKSKSSPKAASPASTPTEGPRATIDVLITFDGQGISSHPNHISLYHGARLFLSSIMKGNTGYRCPVDLYTLTSINMIRKYSFLLDVFPTYLVGIYSPIHRGLKKMFTQDKAAASLSIAGIGKDPKADRVLFVSDAMQYWKARKAMVSGHKSQMVWFRWGWIGVGRYMVINDLKREGATVS